MGWGRRDDVCGFARVPWARLEQLRNSTGHPLPDVVRGANGVGYTAYPDNAIYKFCEQAYEAVDSLSVRLLERC